MQWLIDIIIAVVMPPGMIMLWHSTVATIPSGWTFCDGTLGTPDLRGRFVRSVKSDILGPIPGATGGSTAHTHTFTGDGHAHLLPEGSDIAAGTDFDKDTTTTPAVGTTDVSTHLPLWHALCYIMKL